MSGLSVPWAAVGWKDQTETPLLFNLEGEVHCRDGGGKGKWRLKQMNETGNENWRKLKKLGKE